MIKSSVNVPTRPRRCSLTLTLQSRYASVSHFDRNRIGGLSFRASYDNK